MTSLSSRLLGGLLASQAAILASFQIVQADPIFENSVVSNDIDFIRTDDPSPPFKTMDQVAIPPVQVPTGGD